MPTPAAPNIATRYESDGALWDECLSSGAFIGLTGGTKLLLLERRRLNESPRLTMPEVLMLLINDPRTLQQQ